MKEEKEMTGLKKKAILTHAATWTNLEALCSMKCHIHKRTNIMILLIRGHIFYHDLF